MFIKYGYYETSELSPLIVSVYRILSLAVGRKYIFRLYIKVSKKSFTGSATMRQTKRQPKPD